MTFTRKNRNITLEQPIIFNSTGIDVVPSFKALSVTFQETLSWDANVAALGGKLSRIIGVVYRNRQILPRNIMMHIYNTLFSTRLNYCSLILASSTLQNIEKIHIKKADTHRSLVVPWGIFDFFL